jgi:sugar diacid utilization regulator
MNRWERLLQQLRSILNVPIDLTELSVPEWTARFGRPGSLKRSREDNGLLYFWLSARGERVTALTVEAHLLTQAERALIEMHIDLLRQMDKRSHARAAEDEEERSVRLSQWLSRQIEMGTIGEELPEPFAASLQAVRIPILMYTDPIDRGKIPFRETKRLLESFFDEEIVLIPLLEREWVILAPELVLGAGALEDKENGESLEESLESLCLGLYEMVATEGFGECHLSVDYPIVPAKSLIRSVLLMRESIQLGRMYHIAANVHLPWTLHLERLLQPLPAREKVQFLERILKRAEHILDQEMLSTLEQFFALGCNVSETAKKLYIHRNTLLYRLDKFKQETGLDVRNFNDAVLVKIALLLYKVTKRV